MLSNEQTRKLAGWRVNPIIIGRVKKAAEINKISQNDFVESTLLNATMGIESEEEEKERHEYTDDFLNNFCGKWSGSETSEEILTMIKNSEPSKKVIAL